MKKLLLAGLAAGAWSGCAVAADLGPYTPPPPPAEPIYEPHGRGPWNWQGLYLGGNAGYGWGADSSATYTGVGGPGDGTLNTDGWFGGGQIGYNAQFGAFVLGVEADIQGSDLSDTTALSNAFTTATTDIDWFSTVRGRVGYAAGPTLVYFTGGWAFADVNYTVDSPALTMSSDDIQTGYTLGGGVEWAFAPNWSLKTEYLYVDLGEHTLSSPAGTYTTETDFHTVRAGINYRF